jgi:RHS repeat-associated protein
VGGDGYHVPGAEQQRQYYYHSDHLGSAQLITNYAGEEYERLEYTPYGELWIEQAAEASVLDIAYRFTGKERDEETGNYYYGARYLDPRTSRWLSTDPAMGDYVPGPGKGAKGLSGMGGVYNTINFHVYGYAANNPIKYVDPDGEINIPIAIKHLQDAEGWKNHTIYKDEKRATIGRAGCAITSIANLSNTVGFHSDPWGINNGAYLDEQGDVEWAKAGSQLGLTLVTAGTGGLSSATYEKNESDKKNNYFTIAKVKIDGGNNPHWVGIRGTMTKTDDEGNSKLYYEISPSSKKDATLDPDRVGQGWIKEDGKIYVPADKITKYKIYSQPTSEQ